MDGSAKTPKMFNDFKINFIHVFIVKLRNICRSSVHYSGLQKTRKNGEGGETRLYIELFYLLQIPGMSLKLELARVLFKLEIPQMYYEYNHIFP